MALAYENGDLLDELLALERTLRILVSAIVSKGLLLYVVYSLAYTIERT